MQLREIPQAAVIQVDKRVTKSVAKIFIGLILLGFIILIVMWIPKWTHTQVMEKSTITSTSSSSSTTTTAATAATTTESVPMNKFSREPIEEPISAMTKPFDIKGTITWFIGTIQTLLLTVLAFKKVFGE